MHVQIVTYRVEGVSDPDFIEANREFAEAMAAVPGLLAKVWLRGPEGDGRYGGLYLWRDREAYEAFLASELWGEVLNDPSMLDVQAADYSVMEDLTRATQPGLRVM
ncbi:MAG TPA: YdhR family protein [Candidatus Limnocylindria bacterium]|nr:YdhR family protein [Candidatus Limnocylindria bacterium]